MGLFSWLFGRKNVNKVEDESDGQEQYFKEDFDPKKEQQTKRKSAKAADKTDTEAVSNKEAVTNVKIDKNPQKVKAEEKKAEEKDCAMPKAEEFLDDSPEVKESATVSESKSTKNGKFDIRRAKDGRFFFSLYASNHVVIAYSQIYASLSSCTNGINSVISNAERANIEDTTLKNPSSLSCPKWEIYIDKAGEYRFRLYATNGQCVCHSSHGYSTKSGCKGGIESIKRFAAEARIDKSYLK